MDNYLKNISVHARRAGLAPNEYLCECGRSPRTKKTGTIIPKKRKSRRVGGTCADIRSFGAEFQHPPPNPSTVLLKMQGFSAILHALYLSNVFFHLLFVIGRDFSHIFQDVDRFLFLPLV